MPTVTQISNLSDEILHEVFICLLHSSPRGSTSTKCRRLLSSAKLLALESRPRRKASIHSASEVCNRWQAIINDAGRFWFIDLGLHWGNINSVYHAMEEREWMKRLKNSQNSDIYATLQLIDSNQVVAARCMTSLITKHCHQLAAIEVQIDFTISGGPFPYLFRLSSMPSATLPRLTEMILGVKQWYRGDIDGSSNKLNDSLNLSDLGCLEKFKISYWNLLMVTTLPSQLVELDININLDTPDQWASVRALLRQLRDLRHLAMISSRSSSAHMLEPDPYFLPETLVTFNFNAHERNLIALLGSARINKLTRLTIEFASSDSVDVIDWNPPHLDKLQELSVTFHHWTPNLEVLLAHALPDRLAKLTMYHHTLGFDSHIYQSSTDHPPVQIPTIELLKLYIHDKSAMLLRRLILDRIQAIELSLLSTHNAELPVVSFYLPSLTSLRAGGSSIDMMDDFLRSMRTPSLLTFTLRLYSENSAFPRPPPEPTESKTDSMDRKSSLPTVYATARIVTIAIVPFKCVADGVENTILLFPEARCVNLQFKVPAGQTRRSESQLAMLVEALQSEPHVSLHLEQLHFVQITQPDRKDELLLKKCQTKLKQVAAWRLKKGLPRLSGSFRVTNDSEKASLAVEIWKVG